MAMVSFLVGIPVTYRGYVVPGSLPVSCAHCGQVVLVAPSSFIILHDNPGTQVLCPGCGLQEYRQHPGEIIPISPAQQDEIEEYRRHER